MAMPQRDKKIEAIKRRAAEKKAAEEKKKAEARARASSRGCDWREGECGIISTEKKHEEENRCSPGTRK
jgi:hypothetical protein